ncbi:hypothetical protein [Actinokineospora alba]|uniref:hypothetical protein n=1 Tax=Actinokineospora alba TaxID=504798 RepID=UPI000B8789B0|nr:hypothetical protein [Actinokineospora alba]
MTFAIGIFDLFTYAIPGSLYLAFFAHVITRLHLLGGGAMTGTPAWLLVVLVVVLSYLLGYLAYPAGELANRIVPRRRKRNASQEFRTRVPAAEGRDFVDMDRSVLLSAIELHDKDVAIEVKRLRATGLMLRNSAPPLALGFVAAVVELFAGRNHALAAGCAVLLLGGFVAFIVQARRLAHWAVMKTLELCYWIPDIDDRCRQVPKS